MKFIARYYFLVVAVAFLFVVFSINQPTINSVSLLYLVIVLFCLVVRIRGSYAVSLSNTILGFVILQAFLPESVLEVNFKSLQPNISETVQVGSSGLLPSLDEEIFISTDDRGFRSLHSKTNYENKLILVGGSTTEQLTISDDNTTASLLEGMLVDAGKAVNVVNTGASGLRAIHHAATMRETRSDNSIGYIILLGVNDWNRVLRTSDSYWRSRILRLREPGDWPLTIAVIRLRNMAIGENRVKAPRETPGAYYARVMDAYEEKPKREFETKPAHRRLYTGEIRRVENVCESLPDGQFCIFATQPHGYYPANFEDPDFIRSLWMTPPNKDWALTPESLSKVANEFNGWLSDSVDCRNCYVLNLDEVFGGDPAYFYDDVHFNNAGARLYAEVAYQFLEKNGLLDF